MWKPDATAVHSLLRFLAHLLLQFITDPLGELVVLGVGGHGVVYMASLLGVQVAVKVRILRVGVICGANFFHHVSYFSPLQVLEVAPGANSAVFWQEVSIMQRCLHERITPIYGVALTVCD